MSNYTTIHGIPAAAAAAFSINDYNRTDKKYTIRSGLGGRFTLKYIGLRAGMLVYKITNPDFEHWTVEYEPSALATHITIEP